MSVYKLNALSKLKSAVALGGIAMVITSSGCGGMQQAAKNQSFLKKVNLKSFSDGHDDWIEVQAHISSGKFTLGALAFPIVDPKTSRPYGKLSIVPSIQKMKGLSQANNTGILTISLSITEITQVQGVKAVLPNGTELPIGGLEDSKVLALLAMSPETIQEKMSNSPHTTQDGNTEPEWQKGAPKVYYAFGEGVALLGIAIPFSALDSAGQHAPGTTVFTPLQFGMITASAGFFAGGTSHTTGLGLFIDLSTLINSTVDKTELKPENIPVQGEVPPINAPLIAPTRADESPIRPLQTVTPLVETQAPLTTPSDPSSAQIGKMIFAPVIPPIPDLLRLHTELQRLNSMGLILK